MLKVVELVMVVRMLHEGKEQKQAKMIFVTKDHRK